MKVKSNGKIYDVIEYNKDDNEVLVEDEFDYAYPPYKRMLTMWWTLDEYTVLEL